VLLCDGFRGIEEFGGINEPSACHCDRMKELPGDATHDEKCWSGA
jgi:hypothetical protein